MQDKPSLSTAARGGETPQDIVGSLIFPDNSPHNHGKGDENRAAAAPEKFILCAK